MMKMEFCQGVSLKKILQHLLKIIIVMKGGRFAYVKTDIFTISEMPQ